jgi:hypothetical protein
MTMSIVRGPTTIESCAALVAISTCHVGYDGREEHPQPRDALIGSIHSVQLMSGTAAVIRPMR